MNQNMGGTVTNWLLTKKDKYKELELMLGSL